MIKVEVIQPYNTATFPNPLAIPALIRRAKIPGEVLPWVQSLDQFDAYKLVNPFTGEPDRCTHTCRARHHALRFCRAENTWSTQPGR